MAIFFIRLCQNVLKIFNINAGEIPYPYIMAQIEGAIDYWNRKSSRKNCSVDEYQILNIHVNDDIRKTKQTKGTYLDSVHTNLNMLP